MSPLTLWLMLRGFAGRALEFWRELPGPIKAMILIVLALMVGAAWGEHRADKRCEARIAASIEKAKSVDESISRDARSKAARQAMEADARAAAVESEVKGYVEELAKQTVAGCTIGRDADRLNDGLDVSDGAVQPTRPKSAGGRRHRSEPGSVPESHGKR